MSTQHGELCVESFIDPQFQENGYLVWRRGRVDCWIIDPGFPPQPDEIRAAVASNGLQPGRLLLTHCHVDHIAGVEALKDALPGATLTAPQGEAHMLAEPAANLSAQLNFPIRAPEVEEALAPGDSLDLAGLTFTVHDVSGHSPGGLAFYCAEAGVVFGGDALFNGSIGRTDFPGSSFERLINNIRAQLLSLPDDTVLYSGHGPETTIGHERRSNPFLAMGMRT